MPEVNAAWHRDHPMPASATLDQKVVWHAAHARACACRQIPRSIREAMLARGIEPAAGRASTGPRGARARGGAR
ncbi:MAG TPA: hypothetical protein VFT84_15815 [Gemmatimonadales bacterium]|nr:hypothetical protein [Gemmatimonadales bacterium]